MLPSYRLPPLVQKYSAQGWQAGRVGTDGSTTIQGTLRPSSSTVESETDAGKRHRPHPVCVSGTKGNAALIRRNTYRHGGPYPAELVRLAEGEATAALTSKGEGMMEAVEGDFTPKTTTAIATTGDAVEKDEQDGGLIFRVGERSPSKLCRNHPPAMASATGAATAAAMVSTTTGAPPQTTPTVASSWCPDEAVEYIINYPAKKNQREVRQGHRRRRRRDRGSDQFSGVADVRNTVGAGVFACRRNSVSWETEKDGRSSEYLKHVLSELRAGGDGGGGAVAVVSRLLRDGVSRGGALLGRGGDGGGTNGSGDMVDHFFGIQRQSGHVAILGGRTKGVRATGIILEQIIVMGRAHRPVTLSTRRVLSSLLASLGGIHAGTAKRVPSVENDYKGLQLATRFIYFFTIRLLLFLSEPPLAQNLFQASRYSHDLSYS